jgi:hypothetical protein
MMEEELVKIDDISIKGLMADSSHFITHCNQRYGDRMGTTRDVNQTNASNVSLTY